MKKTLLKYRNADSTLDLNTQLAEFFSKGIVSGGEVLAVFPNSTPQVTVAPFKLIGADGMVVIETSLVELLNLPANQTTVVCFKSLYVSGGDPELGFETLDISTYNALAAPDKAARLIFAIVTTTAPANQPSISLDLRDVIDPVGRKLLRGTVTSAASLPATKNLLGDAYIVESGVPDPNNGVYIWKGTGQGWVNTTDAISVANLLAQHRSNLFSNEIHLTDAQADAVLGTSGSPSITNKFVTDQDPRIPTQSEKDALVGLSQNVPTIPSATNPFVTSAYNLSEPSEVLLTPPGAYITLNAVQGPFFVGQGVGMSTVLQYFNAFVATTNREYVNTLGDRVVLTGVYKSLVGPTPLDPSAEATVTAANGFWNGQLFFTYSGTIDSNFRFRFGKQLNLQNISRGFPVKPGPQDASLSSEALKRFLDISGRLFDDPIQVGESNVELYQTHLDLRRYLNTTTAADVVVPGRIFPRLRKISDIAADFPADYAETVEFGLTPANYTVYWQPADVANFDPGYAEDIPVVSYIQYAPGNILPPISPGWIWQDDLGTRFRILAYDAANRSILLYTQGMAINGSNANGNLSKIYRANNPRQLEINSDHQTSMYREVFPVDDISPIKDAFEALPPGGVFVGSFTPVNNFSLIGTGVLPNQGNPTGASRGRPLFNIIPFNQGQIPDPRVVLIGNWESDQVLYPRQALGNVSQGALGVQFTGRISRLTLFTKIRPTMPYGFRVFIDGAYNHTASQFLTDPNIGAGLVPSNAIAGLRGDTQKAMQPLFFNLGISDNLIHTVRVEVTVEGTDPFPLYGIETFYAGAYETKGNAFTSTDFVPTLTNDTIATPIISSPRGRKMVRYIDRATKVRSIANTQMPQVFDNAVSTISASANFNSAAIAQGCNPGDIVTISIPAISPSNPFYVYRRIVSVNKATGAVVVDAAVGSTGVNRVELVFRTPSSPSGTPVVGAPQSSAQEEYARFYLADWSVGLSQDVANLGTAAMDTRTTVLDDATTAISVIDCKKVDTGIEGFTEAIRMETLTASMTMTAWCTGMDVVFVGSSGGTSTVNIEIDGSLVYQVTVPIDGMVRHSLFFDGSPQSHVVRIYNPSVASKVAVGQWIFHTIKSPAIDGTKISEYEISRNATSFTSSGLDLAWFGYTTGRTVQNAGVRLFDITKQGARFYNGTSGTLDWTVIADTTRFPIFGTYLRTDRVDAICEIQTVGTYAEIYFLGGPTFGITQIYIDGLIASAANFPGISSGQYNGANGQIDMYGAATFVASVRIPNLTQGQHVIRLQNTNTKNVASTNFFSSIAMAAEQPGTAVVSRRFTEDPKINRLHFESIRDTRNFLTLTPDQLGVVSSFDDVTVDLPVTGYLNGAFCMSDGSGVEVNCTVGVLGGFSYVDISFPYTLALNPGLTVGDLEVIVDGQVLPRKVGGATLDAWYTEDLITVGRINFWADLSGSPISIDIRRKSGTIDTNTLTTARVAVCNGTVVGSLSQVAAGVADYVSLVTALPAVAVGGKITVLTGTNAVANPNITKRVFIEGQGYDAIHTGIITLKTGSSFSIVRGVRATQFVIDSGVVGVQLIDCIWDADPTDANPIGSNRITGMSTV